MIGFATVLDSVAGEWEGLCNNDPMANGIQTMIRVLKDDIATLENMRTQEWELRRLIDSEAK